MSRKKQVVQEELQTQADFDEFLAKDGLKGVSSTATSPFILQCNHACHSLLLSLPDDLDQPMMGLP